MADLNHSLQGRDIGHLRIIAELWGLPFSAPDERTGLRLLLPQMLNVELLGEIIEALPKNAQEALQELLSKNGIIPWSMFTRAHGSLREMGPARRDREQPYLDAFASACEALWYRGLIGRTFFDTPNGPQEFAFIPEDLLTLMPKPPEKQTLPFGRPASQAEKAISMGVDDSLVDDACTLLAALRTNLPLEVVQSYLICGKGRPFPVTVQALLGLLKAAELLDKDGLLQPESTRAFLEASRGESLELLTRSWLGSQDFNELQMLPGLQLEGEWRNDPLRSRKALIEFLSLIPGWPLADQEVPEPSYWNLGEFIHDIHRESPDFQRSAGEYDSWFIRDSANQEFLRGFEHWEDVEGNLLRFLISGPMHWLGILDLAGRGDAQPVSQQRASSFRFSSWAGALLSGLAPPGLAAEEQKVKVSMDGEVVIPRFAPRTVRYQVARFCEWKSIGENHYTYQLTPASLERARANGLSTTSLLALLQRNVDSFPPSLTTALNRWEQYGSQAWLEQDIVLRLKDADILLALRKSRAARFLGDPLGPAAVIVRPGAVKKVLEILAEMGYLGDSRIDSVEWN